MTELLIKLSQSSFSLAIANSSWVVPTMQSIHIVSLAVVFISVVAVALRVMGLAWSDVSIRKTVDQFTPWAFVALILLTVTGVVLILAEPIRELMAISFWIKMVLLATLIVVSTRFLQTVRHQAAFADIEGSADARTHRMAIVSITVVVLIIFMGRFIAYDPLIWGNASPITSIYAG